MSYYLHNLFPDVYYDKTHNYDTLVLSGGGTKGFILLGALQYFYDNDLLKNTKTYIGTSVGSIIAYLLCIGYTPQEIWENLHINNWMDNLKDINILNIINNKGATSFIYIQEMIEKLTLNKIDRFLTFKNLYDKYGKHLIVCTYNITKLEIEYLDYINSPDLQITIALRMSSNIPIFFDKFKYMHSYYLDGGIGDAFPILEGIKFGKETLGLNLLASTHVDSSDNDLISYLGKLSRIMMQQKVSIQCEIAEKNEACTIINLFNDNNFINFNISKVEQTNMYINGYNQAKNFFNIHLERNLKQNQPLT